MRVSIKAYSSPNMPMVIRGGINNIDIYHGIARTKNGNIYIITPKKCKTTRFISTTTNTMHIG